ncbi:MAG: ABC transporter ATP-binding protein, partial [Paracoccaceae bacterium]
MRIGDLIDPFAEAEGPPPQTLGRFFLWALGGSMPVLIVAALASCLAGTLEVVTAMLLGTVIDTALNTGPDQFFSKNAALILGFVAFFLIIRPVVFGFSAAANSIVVGPNINPLVLSRLHRWTLGQAVTFFDDDFAGRIAQKQMQTARALTDVTVESINVVAFALASLVGSGLLLLTID